jgi:catechol 2,3-dioxygenase-like lactoylglutathione lyase family enzyme
VPTFNHIGLLVTDLPRAKTFYQEVLGFTPWFEGTPDDEGTTRLLSLPGPLDVVAGYLVLDVGYRDHLPPRPATS